MEPSGSEEDRFVCYFDKPNLQELASYRAALSLWCSHISRSNRGDDPTSLRFSVHLATYYLHRDLNEMVECLKMPPALEKLLKKALTRVAQETSDWLGELRDIIGTGVYDLNWWVWFDDGRIDHKRSALKLLSSNNEMSYVQKFALMSKFCLEDEMVKFSLDLLPEDFTSHSIFKNEHLIQYWYYRTKNELQNVQTLTHVAVRCFSSRSFKRWTAFEYFWYHLDTNQQIRVVTHIIVHNHHTAQLLERLLDKMSWHQQRRVLALNRSQMICKFASESDSLRAAHWAWTHSKGRITVKIFVEFVGCLIERRLNAEEWMSWLVEVWDSAPDKYKTYAAKRMKHKFYFGYIFNENYSLSSFKILSEILSLQSVDARRKMILEQAKHFGPHMIDRHSLNEMLRLYLPNADDQQKFKKLVLESVNMKSVCTDLIVTANFDRLNMLLEFYLDTPNDVLLFKKELLESKNFSSKYVRYHTDQWNAVGRFIAKEMFPENASLILQTKKQLFCSIFDSYFHYDCDDDSSSALEILTGLIQSVDSEFTKHDVIDLKRTLWCSVQLMLKNRHYSLWYEAFFNEKCFLRFVRWCVGDGDRVVLDFENGFFVNTIFDGVFVALNKKYSPEWPEKTKSRFNDLLLIDLEEYLSWYFVSYGKMGKYKLGRMQSFQVSKIFRAAVNRGDESSLRILLNWFFQYDESAIRKFRSNKLLRFQTDAELEWRDRWLSFH